MQDEPEDRYSSLYPEGYHVAGTVKRLKGHGYLVIFKYDGKIMSHKLSKAIDLW